MDESLAGNLAGQLDALGLRFGEPVDLTGLPEQATVSVTLVHEQGRAPYRVGFAASLTGSSLEWARPHHAEHERILLLGPRVTERSAEIFRARGINYLDQAGNAYITFAGVHIDVRGRRSPQAAQVGPGVPRLTRGGVNLFSVKRSQVIFAILNWSALLDAPIREIARNAGVSIGQAQETLELLTQYGFLDERRRVLPHRREQLIDQWTAAYPTGLGADAKTRRFSGEFENLDPADAPVYVSGEAAVPDLLRPETAVLYTDTFPIELIRAHRWRRNDERPNIVLRRQFWPTPQEQEAPGAYAAPWLLVYADLLASNDSRQRDAAQQLREIETQR